MRTPLLIGRGSDIPVCVCAFEDACAAAVRQREVSSRDARSSFSEFDLFSERLTVTPGFSAIFQIAADFALRRVF